MEHILRAIAVALLASYCTEGISVENKEEVRVFTQEWANKGALSWLTTLRDRPRAIFYVGYAPKGWIREADLPTLVAQVHSTAPSGMVCYVASAHAVPTSFQSPVGREAAILVDAFRRQQPYPRSCSDLNAVDTAELLHWWSRREK